VAFTLQTLLQKDLTINNQIVKRDVELDENLETKHRGLFVIGDGSGVTHSLSHASASGVYVADLITERIKNK
jgi:uncharacterized FAD-dependent dehydrogenase